MRTKLVTLGLALAVGAVSTSANAQDYFIRDNGLETYHTAPRWRESESHPLRVFAYMTHWMGWVSREALFRPLSAYAASTPFTRSFMGYREPFDFRESVCFSTSDAVPDCRKVSPYANIKATNVDMMADEPAADADAGAMVGGAERQVFFPDVNFDFDKAQLNDLGKGRVRQVAQLLNSVPSLTVVVEGHADFKGTDEYNQDLGQRRAQAVVDELAALGVDVARLSPMSFGESKPVFTEEEDWARAINRRVQFSVQGATPTEAAAEMPAAEEATEETM